LPHIALAATMVTANKTTMQDVSTLLTILMAMAVRRYNTVRITQRRRSRAFIKATKRCHQVSTCSDKHKSDMPTPVLFGLFHRQMVKKGLGLTFWLPITIGV
jgi:hypothetical protein